MAACLAIVRLNASVSTVRKVHFIESFGDMFYTCMGLYVLTTQIWKAVGCEFILACVVSACIAGLYLLWLRHRLYVLLILPYIMHIKRPVDAYNYICGVEVLLESRDDQSRGLLAGIALNHNRICDNVTCWCQDVKNAMSSKGKDPGHRGELRDNPPLNVETEKAVDYQNRSKIGRWLLSLQTDIMMSQNNALMNILVSYIYYFYIGNAYQSLNYLDIAETFKPSFLESFAIYIHRRRIESAVLQMHDANLFEGAMPIDIVNTLEFSATYNDFLEIVQTCADTYHEFWKELMKDLPDCKILSDCGRQISEKWQNIQKLFNKLLILMPKNMNYLYLFGLFIKYITNDSEEAKKIHQKLVYIRNSKSHLKGPEYEKYQDEGKAMMFLVSGSRDSIGRIKEVNIETEKILGYARKDLRGNKVNKLMCSVLAETHDGFITRFYETLISNKVNHSFFQYFKESSAFYIPVQMLVRVVPNLSDGLEFCCLCYRNESNPYVASKINKTRNRVGTIICDESFKVLGITRSCARTLKLPPNIAQKGFPDNFVLSIFPMLRDENARNKLFENRGRVINYNLDRLQELDIDDEDAKTPGGEPTKYVKKDDLLIWVRLVKQDFNDSKAVLILIVLDQVPNIDAANYIGTFPSD
ncbi:MAG: PAS domain S-box protein [Candidatus Pacebacteria bacterium]|nr:PAS domain S-box protein [Candidatus Paceibacterota bacterium]